MSLTTRNAVSLIITAILVATLVLSGNAVAVASPDAAAKSAPSGLRVEGLEKPVDLAELAAPALSWRVNTPLQSAYRIRVSSSADAANNGNADVWDSGKKRSADQIGVAYGGPKLAAGTRYWWTVQTFDAKNVASARSDVTWFGTAPGAEWKNARSIWTSNNLPDSEEGTGGEWTDYTLSADLTIAQTALGVSFRTSSTRDGYMWQFRADTNELRPHVRSGGAFQQLDTVALPAGAVTAGSPFNVKIAVEGPLIVTSIDGVEVDRRELSEHTFGEIGFRTGRSESGSVANLIVTDVSGEQLFSDPFTGTNPFPCGTVQGGVLSIDKSTDCTLPRDSGTAWAFLRTEIPLAKKTVETATLTATASDFRAHSQHTYKIYVNGQFVGLGPTNRVGSESRYDGFDITSLVRAGKKNAISALAYTSDDDRQKFIAQLRVTYSDGSTDTFGTDETWKAMPGSQVYPDAGSIGTRVFAAPKENLDARRFPHGFTKVGFDDSGWAPASAAAPFQDLQATPTAKVQQQYPKPVSIVDKGNGNYFIDFGRTWVGGIRYKIANAQDGASVDLRFGETTSAPESVRYQLSTGNVYQDVVTLRGGAQSIETWGMRVFRYVEVRGAPEPIKLENFSALALVYPFDAKDSEFSSSDSNLNQVYQLSKNTIESLNVNFYTDSWTRERINYEADSYLQLMSSLYLMDDLSLGRYSMDYFKQNRTWPTEWPMYVVLGVHDAWRQTGNTKQVKEYFDNLETKMPTKWIDEKTGLVRKTSGSDGCNSRTDCDIVDWPSSQRDGFQFREVNTVVNALSYRAMRDMAAMADAIGRADAAQKYSAQANRLRTAMNTYLFDPEVGAYDDGMAADGTRTGNFSIHASAFSLAFGVPTGDDKTEVAEFVTDKQMACSVYCAGFAVPGLFAGGAEDAAVNLMTNEGTSSWMNMLSLGAGATMEAWDPSQKSNLTYSHPWAASPAFHVPSGLFGIQPIDPGYAKFAVRPAPGGVENARITVPTVRGSVGAAFSEGAPGFEAPRLLAQIPGNTKADLSLPVPAGTKLVYLDGVPRKVKAADGYVTVKDVAAGCRLLTLEPGQKPAEDPALRALCAPEIAR